VNYRVGWLRPGDSFSSYEVNVEADSLETVRDAAGRMVRFYKKERVDLGGLRSGIIVHNFVEQKVLVGEFSNYTYIIRENPAKLPEQS
jgi:hypothetical protein